mmetsp:Transcript_19445/g.27955  ORF Transcript_19445/g.27955 Transcript_19445/m.27955 type:complete len:577 (-) Transcript_19445:110-1840(-)
MSTTRFPLFPKFRRSTFKYGRLDESPSPYEHTHNRRYSTKYKTIQQKIKSLLESPQKQLYNICRETGSVSDMKKIIHRKWRLKIIHKNDEQMIDQPIHEAAFNGFIEAVKFLVDEVGVDVNAVTAGGHTPLILACIGGHVDIVSYLYESGANANLTSRDGASPLHWASLNGHFDCVHYLLSSTELTATASTFTGMPSLHLACAMGHVHVARLMIEEFLLPVEFVNEDGDTALHYASFEGREAVVRYLVQAGADLYSRDKAGYTPLHLASSRGHDHVVAYILSCIGPGALRSIDLTGATPLHQACAGGHVDTVKVAINRFPANRSGSEVSDTSVLMIRDKEGRSCLHAAVAANKLRMVIVLVKEFSCDVEALDEDGYTPFLVAVSHGNLEVVVKFVEEFDVDKFILNRMGYGALHIACEKGHSRVVQYLVKAGLDPRQRSRSGDSALFLACYHGHLEIVQYLLQQHGVHRECIDNDNKSTPLITACMRGHLELVQYLISTAMVQMTAVDKFGRTGLHWACANGAVKVVKYLLSVPNSSELLWIKDLEGRTAADLSVSQEVDQLLHKAIKYDSGNKKY